MEKKQILEWAIAGARSQLTALENELAAISKGLKTGTRVLKGKPVKRRKLYTMSAAARKAASQRMKAYWAKRHSKQKRRIKA